MAIEASEELASQGIHVDLLEISTIKPLDVATLLASTSKTGRILTVEEHNLFGGMGEAVAMALAKEGPARMDSVAIQDTFAESGPYDELMTKYGICTQQILAKAKRLLDI
jgi:transketolase